MKRLRNYSRISERAIMTTVNAAAPDISKLVELSLAAPIYRATMVGPHRSFLTECLLTVPAISFAEIKGAKTLECDVPFTREN